MRVEAIYREAEPPVKYIEFTRSFGVWVGEFVSRFPGGCMNIL